MIKRIFFIALMSFLSAGLLSAQTKPNDKAIVYVYSYKHIKTLGRVAPPVYLDDKVLAKLDGERYFIVLVSPGTHKFNLKDKKRGGIEAEFLAGETYYIRMNMREGVTVGPSGLVLMPKENGTFDIKEMKPIKKDDIKAPDIVFDSVPS